ncbi:MAG: M14 family metallopeptidase [Candidatus Poribacteria bacterium]|nr:M14 family metallopeptidase [Candidatus Poribacteria bacterium]
MHFRHLDIGQLPRQRKETGWLEVATQLDGGVCHLPFLYVTGRTAGPTLVVTAAVHGNEYEGVETIPRVFQQIEPERLQGTLVMVPVCNVPAYEAATRNSPIDGLNLARVFPGDAHGTITQRIAYFITEKLLKPADFFIDLHSGGMTAKIPTLIGYIHSDDELGKRSQAAAKAFGAPVLWAHPPPVPPGRSLSAATDLSVPSLYTEARGGGYARLDDVSCFTTGVLNVMKHLNMLDGEPQPRLMTHYLIGDGNMDTVISTPAAGYFRADVALLDEVNAGQRLGTVVDPFGEVVAEITTERAGVVIMLRRVHPVHVGDGLAHVTGRLE